MDVRIRRQTRKVDGIAYRTKENTLYGFIKDLIPKHYTEIKLNGEDLSTT